MTAISDSNQAIQAEETDQDSPVTESLLQKLGGTINYLRTTVGSLQSQITSNDGEIATIRTAINELANTGLGDVPILVKSGTVSLASDTDANWNFFIWKDIGAGITYMNHWLDRAQLADPSNTSTDLDIDPSTWSYATVNGYRSGSTYRIEYFLFTTVDINNV